jgi:hypothetical protein
VNNFEKATSEVAAGKEKSNQGVTQADDVRDSASVDSETAGTERAEQQATKMDDPDSNPKS